MPASTEDIVDDAPAAARNDAARAVALDLPEEPASGADVAVGWTVTINRPVGEVYGFFRDFANLPTVMENVERIDVIDRDRSHWVVKAPAGRTVEWDARVTADESERRIAWTSEAGADIANSGVVTFADAGARGTIVGATLVYDPPGGTIGKLVAKLFQREPAIQARRDLRRLKQFLETGEIATAVRNRATLAAREN